MMILVEKAMASLRNKSSALLKHHVDAWADLDHRMNQL